MAGLYTSRFILIFNNNQLNQYQYINILKLNVIKDSDVTIEDSSTCNCTTWLRERKWYIQADVNISMPLGIANERLQIIKASY